MIVYTSNDRVSFEKVEALLEKVFVVKGSLAPVVIVSTCQDPHKKVVSEIEGNEYADRKYLYHFDSDSFEKALHQLVRLIWREKMCKGIEPKKKQRGLIAKIKSKLYLKESV